MITAAKAVTNNIAVRGRQGFVNSCVQLVWNGRQQSFWWMASTWQVLALHKAMTNSCAVPGTWSLKSSGNKHCLISRHLFTFTLCDFLHLSPLHDKFWKWVVDNMCYFNDEAEYKQDMRQQDGGTKILNACWCYHISLSTTQVHEGKEAPLYSKHLP